MMYRDHSNYDESGMPPALEPGTYLIKLDEIRSENRDGGPLIDNNGERYHNFIFTVEDKPNKLFEKFYYVDVEPPEGAPFADLRCGKFKQFLMAVGAKVEGGDLSHLLGLCCRAIVKIREYQGKTYNNIFSFDPKDEGDQFGGEEDKDLPF